jgi:hypothetical protein
MMTDLGFLSNENDHETIDQGLVPNLRRKMEHNDCSTTLETEKDLEDSIWDLRNIYLSIDYDISLWESLFACFDTSNSNTPVDLDENKITHECSEKHQSNNQTKESFSLLSCQSSRNQNSMLTLATISTFLDIPMNDIPTKYLTMSPASDGMLCLQLDHPHAHDDLLLSLTNALWRVSIELHTRIVAIRAQSVPDQIRILNAAIHNLTDLNQIQLQQSLPVNLPNEEELVVDRDTKYERTALLADCTGRILPGAIRRAHSQALPNSKTIQWNCK